MAQLPIIPCTHENDSATATILERVRELFGNVPSALLTAAHPRPVLESLWSQLEASCEMSLSRRMREAIALRVAELNQCAYCLAGHAESSRELGMSRDEITMFRQGRANDGKEQALLALATKLVAQRGHHARLVIDSARILGVSDRELVEVVALVSLHTLLNYLTVLANTKLDSPGVDDLAVEEASESRST